MQINADFMRIGKREISIKSYLGRQVDVIIDRPLGSRHSKYPNLVYEVNYGYIPGTKAADGEEIDVYVLGEDKPLKNFTGRVIAIVERLDDNEGKLVSAALGHRFTAEQIAKQINFQEKYYQSQVILCESKANRKNNREEFYTRALLYDSKTNSVLLYKRAGSDQWTMFGGTAEDNEMPWECFIREMKEELAIDLRKFKIKLLEHRLDKERDSERHVYYVECDRDLIKKVPENHADYKWISLEEILDYDLTEHTRRDLEFFRRTKNG